MTASQLSKAVHDLRQTILHQEGAGLSEGQLLDQFVGQRDAAAFAALVQRLGPMVWGVCRRVLGCHHDAEDAFQATFLVLARKAAVVMPRDMVANWLYGVAYRTARKAKTMTDRRRAREKQVPTMPEPQAPAPDPWRDLEPLVDQELARLPDKYRSAIIFCDLEGKTRKEAARQLRIPEGTLSSRLTTAREKLARQLARHGVTLSAAAVATLLAQNAASASIPSSVVSILIKVGPLFAARQAAAMGLVSAKVAALTQAVLKTMMLGKLQTALAVVLVLGVIGLGGSLITQATAVDESPKAADETIPEQKKSPADTGSTAADPGQRLLGGKIRLEDREKSVATVDLNGTQLTDADLKILKQFKGLRQLGLVGCHAVTDAGLKEIKDLNELRVLRLGGTAVTDAGLKELKGLKELRHLGLAGTQVTDKGLKELKGLKNLRELVLAQTGVTDEGLKEFKDLKELRELRLSGTAVADAGLKQLKELKALLILDLAGTPVTDAGLGELKELKKLQALGLAHTTVTDDGLKELEDLKELRELQLGRTTVTDAGLKALKGLNELRLLGLPGTQVSDMGLKELKGLKNLQELVLAATGVTDKGLKELKDLKELRGLWLGGTTVTDAGLKELKELKALQILGLAGTRVTDGGLKELKELKNLQKLWLAYTAVTDEGLRELKGLKKLRLLVLTGTKVTAAGVADLKKAIPEVQIVTEDLDGD
jgi:RNA polymerase sigma factor (sigma-70 family)